MFGYLYSEDQQPNQQDILGQLQDVDILVTLFAPPVSTYDPDQQHQFQFDYYFDKEFSDIVLWPIPEPHHVIQPRPASVTNMSRKQRIWVSKAAMMESFVNPERFVPPAPIIYGWDTDTENQFLQPAWGLDYWEEQDIQFPVVIIIFVLGTGSVSITTLASGEIDTTNATGAIGSITSGTGSVNQTAGAGGVTPLIDPGGKLLP
jgi:hypothetical protein